jgi:hypothetical protein
MQGDELNAQAVLAGTGTGTVIGEWVWDGIAVEQFSATIVGGESTAIETRQSLPTWLLGAHTLQLRMLEPNRVASEKIEVAVNPGDWKLEQLIQPESGAVFDVNEAPHLLWAVVPGAMKYQVGFSSEPYLSTVGDWYDVTENQWEAPAEIWQSLPQGRLYWTVRTVDPSGEPRRPLPMRVLYRGQEGASAPRSVAASQLPGRMMGVDAKTILRGADGEMIPIKADLLHGEYAAPGIAPQSVSIPTPAPAKSATDAEEPKPTSATPKKKVGPAEDGQIANHAQVASGGDLPDTDVLTVAEHIKYQQGAWHFELNGSGLLNSVLSPGVQRTVVDKNLGSEFTLRHCEPAALYRGAIRYRSHSEARRGAGGEDACGHLQRVLEYERCGAGRRSQYEHSPADGGSKLAGAVAAVGATARDVAERIGQYLRQRFQRRGRCGRGDACYSIEQETEMAVDDRVCGELRQSRYSVFSFGAAVRPCVADGNHRAAGQNKGQRKLPRRECKLRQPGQSQPDAEQHARREGRECLDCADHEKCGHLRIQLCLPGQQRSANNQRRVAVEQF